MNSGDQERLRRLIPNRETQMEIDPETQRRREAEWGRQKTVGGEGWKLEEDGCGREK